MRYRKTCALYDEVNMGNAGNVPWCSDKGFEPDCENCTRPDKINADRIRVMTDEEIEDWYWWMHKEMKWYTDSRAFVHNWLKSPVAVDDTEMGDALSGYSN